MSGWFPRVLTLTATTQLLVYGLRPLLSYMGLSIQATPAELGLIAGAFSALSLLVAVPLGFLIDRTGERPFVLGGTSLLVCVPACLLFPQTIPTLALCSAGMGLGQLAAMLGAQTVIARGDSEAVRDRRFAHFTVVTSGAQLVAPATLGLLVGRSTPVGQQASELTAGAALLTAVTVGSVGLLAALSLVARPGTLASRPRPVRQASFGTVGRAVRVPSMRIALMASFTVLASIDLVAAYLPALGQAQGLGVMTVGLLLATLGGASLAARLALPRLLHVLSRRILLASCMTVAAVGMALIPWVSWLPGLYLVMALAGMGLGLGQPITMGWVASEAAPEIRGTAMSVRLMGNRLAQTVVPLVVGALAGAAGLAAAFTVPGGLLLLAAFLSLLGTDGSAEGARPKD